MGLLDDTDCVPYETLEVEDDGKKKITMKNPAYVTWIAWDQQMLHFF